MIALVAAGVLAGAPPADRLLIWADEFEGDTLDLSRWSVVEDCWGGGNNERQCYAAPNVLVRDGHLVLTARHEQVSGLPDPSSPHPDQPVVRSWSSGKVHTRGLASFRYGRIEVRARLPQGQGLWPAIWMLPEHDNYGPDPRSGEIDIVEAVNLGVDCDGCRNQVYGARHHGPSLDENQQEGGSVSLGDPAAFHIFALEWTPERLTWLVDDEPYFSADGGPPWDQRFHLILNLAVGGNWAERSGTLGVDLSVFPAEFLVDYVRIYEHSPGPRAAL